MAEKEKEKQKLEARQKEEEAFLKADNEAITLENADQMKTKRIIDRMMSAAQPRVANEICELLANYKGSIFFFYLH